MNVNPYHVFAFIGNVNLTPASDIWQDQTQLPEVRINREGNFDALLAESADLGTVWNAWQTNWVGEPTTVSTEVLSTSSGSWSGDPHKVVNGYRVQKYQERLQVQSKHKVELVLELL